jgi:Ni,Fe-hydrogenase I cytochrome b subunit
MESFVGATMHLLLFKIYLRVRWCAGSVTLSKHVTRYGPWAGFPYYNLAIHYQEDSATQGHAEHRLGVWAVGTFTSTQPQIVYKL